MGIRLLSRKRSYPTPLLFNAGEWELYNKSITYFFTYSLKSSLVNSSFNRLMVVNLCFIRKYFSYMKLIYGLIYLLGLTLLIKRKRGQISVIA